LSVVSVAPPLADPVRGTDWISYLAWYVNGARWAFESIAEIRGYTLDPVEIPEARPTRRAPAHRYLVDSLRARSGDASDYELAGIGRLASHLKRVDEIGAQFDADELAELANLLGHRPDPTTPMPSSWRTSRLPHRTTKRRWCVCSTRACSGSTSRWRRRPR